MSRREPTADVPTTAQAVKQMILQRLGEQWRPGDRLPALAELAAMLNVGQRSTYQALRELCDAGLLVARQGKGTFVRGDLTTQQVQQVERAQPGNSAASLAGRSVRVLVAGAGAGPGALGMIQQMVQAGEDELAAAGARVRRDSIPPLNDLRPLGDRGDDALLLINPNTSTPIRFDPRQKLAVASTTAHLMVAAGEDFDLVSANEEQGGFLAGRYLRQVGCTDPAFVGTADVNTPGELEPLCRARLRGLEAGFGAELPGSRLFVVRRYGLVSGASAVAEFQCLTRRPDGIFAASDELAAGFVAGAAAFGLQHDRDYHIVGFDGQQQYCVLDGRPLVSVAVPAAELGRQAARLLIERLRHPQQPPRSLSIGCSLANAPILADA